MTNFQRKTLGTIDYGRKSSEQGNVQFRRFLYFVKDMKAGDVITEDCVRSVRPGYGLAPKYFCQIVGKRLKVDARCNMPASWNLVDS